MRVILGISKTKQILKESFRHSTWLLSVSKKKKQQQQ